MIVRHIGSARNEQERLDLLSLASDFIEKSTKQLNLFGHKQANNLLYLNQTEFIGVYYNFLYKLISKLIIAVGFDKIKNGLLLDIVILRMVEPASKLRSIALLDEYFGIKHRRQSYYQSAPQWLSLKTKTEAIALTFARKHYSFNFKSIPSSNPVIVV
ncbi:MAG: hypothetical protein IPH58_05740 [Sphingobacteriales bacterium]|nr:hypothetical protein [Sphingobacteriales bacterium]